MEFWHNPPQWIAVGGTPQDAIAALKAKYPDFEDDFDDPFK